MRKLLVLALLFVSTVACAANYVVDPRFGNSPFPVELGHFQWDAANHATVLNGRILNRSGAEQADVRLRLNFFRGNAPAGTVTTDIGHMFPDTYAYFHIFARDMDLRGASAFGADLHQGGNVIHSQSPDIWEGYTSDTGYGIPTIPVAEGRTTAFPIEQLHVDPLRFHQGSRIEGLIHNVTDEDIANAWFRILFYDKNANLMDTLRIHVPHMGPGRSVVFSGQSRRDDLNRWYSYVLHREVADPIPVDTGYLQPAEVAQPVAQQYVSPAVGYVAGNVAAPAYVPAPTMVVQAPATTIVREPAIIVDDARVTEPTRIIRDPSIVVTDGAPAVAYSDGYVANTTVPAYVNAGIPGQVALQYHSTPSRHDIKLSNLRINHSGGGVQQVFGEVTNHSGHNLGPSHFTAVFFDRSHNKLGSMNFSVSHLTNGDTTNFRADHVQGNFTHHDLYQLYIDR